MGKRRVYDTLVWLKKIKKAGFEEFTHAELVEVGLGNLSCMIQATKAGFIKAIAINRNLTKVWTFDYHGIKQSTKKRVFFED